MDMTIYDSPGALDNTKDYASGLALRDCLVASYGLLHRRLTRFLGCEDMASDCLHDAWIHLGDKTVPAAVGNPDAYVYRVAHNLAIDRVRGSHAQRYLDNSEGELAALADTAPGPENLAEVRSEMAAVDGALEDMPTRHRDILLALRVDESSRADVARDHGVSVRRVDTVLREAVDLCASRLAEARAPVVPVP